MAQLSDDCFAFGDALLSVEQAEALVATRIPPLAGSEMLALHLLRGRILAAPLLAAVPLPPFFNAAVDGYAFRHADLTAGAATALPLAGRVAAGHGAAALPAGAAMRIFTGAPMPAGADSVLMQEDAPEIGLAAALGQAVLPVRPLVRVGVFSTGDELATPGTTLGPAQTFDSNRFTLLALLGGLPVVATDLGILPDNAEATRAALAAAAGQHDLLLTSGGVSMGEEDHVRAAIQQGGSLVFWRLAVKPGRPAAMGVIGGTPVLGLPGNPVAAVVTFLHLARPLILRLAGARAEPLPRFPAQATFQYRKKAGRREYVRVRLLPGAPLPLAEKFAREGAGLLSSLTQSDAFAELPEEVTAVAPGDTVQVLPFAACF